jgi:protein SCO1/2
VGKGFSLLIVAIALSAGTALAEDAVGGARDGKAFDPDAALRFSQSVIGKPVGDFAFLDRRERQVRLADYRGKPLVVSFVYTGCFSACPTTTARVAKAIRAARSTLGTGAFNVVSIGFNLPYDSPPSMRDFARRYGVDDPGWKFLTPYEKELPALTAQMGFTFVATPAGFDHITQLTILDAQGRVYRQVYGEDFALPLFVEPLRQLATGETVPANSLTGVIDRIRLLCTVYDPRAGVYRFQWSIVSSLVTFVFMLIGGIWYLWHEIRKRRRHDRARTATSMS